ncbi:MAG: oligosaccharide flippase family protein [Hyphomicrobiales bacterium]|nr:oligosaccharide flippase family protein [Hyphomicrobiales bacterium]
MSSKSQRAPAARLVGWLGWAGLDAVGRLALMTGSTIVFSRLLAPRDFGVAALVLTIVAAAAIFVGTPFEEALAQRRHLRMKHLRAALGASWAIAAVILAISIAGAKWLAARYGEPEIGVFLPVAMASIFFSGHSDIATALARRLRKFNDVAYATLVGHIIGVGLSLVIAVAGFGVWALVLQRPLILAVRAVLLQARLGYFIRPVLSFGLAREFGRFAGVSFLARLTDNVTYLVFNNVVEAFYGVAVLGQVNMAMRLIEPIRGAILATSHNLAFTFFARASDPLRQRVLIEQVVSQAAIATAPVFMGMAAIAPQLLPIVAGPGWDDAVGITICLSIASVFAVPSQLIYTAFSANARPGLSFVSLIFGFAAILLILVGFRSFGPISVGLSRIAGDVMRAGFAVGLSSSYLGLSRRARFDALVPAWAYAGAMGYSVYVLGAFVPDHPAMLKLALLILCGIIIYAALVLTLARPTADALMSHVQLPKWRRRSEFTS